MNWNEILSVVTQAVVIPLVLALGGFLASLIQKKAKDLSAQTESELLKAAAAAAAGVVAQAVEFTAQTYADVLKAEGAFNEKAKKKAFLLARKTALALLSEDAKRAVETLYGDLELWLKTKIEQAVYARNAALTA